MPINLTRPLVFFDLETTGTKLDFLDDILLHDCILLDDLGSERLTEAARQNIYFIIDECYTLSIPLIITSNNSIEEINIKEPRIASRLSAGSVLYLNSSDYRIKNKVQ